MTWRRRAAAAEEQSERAIKEQQQAEHESRLAKREKDKSVTECLSWREKHQALADIYRAQEDLISQRQNKAVRLNNGPILDSTSDFELPYDPFVYCLFINECNQFHVWWKSVFYFYFIYKSSVKQP